MPANSALPPASKKRSKKRLCLAGLWWMPCKNRKATRRLEIDSSRVEGGGNELGGEPDKMPGAPNQGSSLIAKTVAEPSLQTELLRPQERDSWRHEVAARVEQLPGTQTSSCAALSVVAAEVRTSRTLDRSSGGPASDHRGSQSSRSCDAGCSRCFSARAVDPARNL